jgi:site-specific recombinase XerC
MLRRCFRGNSFEDRRDAAVLTVLLATGIRVSELAAIRYCRDDPDRSDVDLESRESKVRGKGGRDRTVKISHEAARRLNRYLRAKSRTSLERIHQLVVRRGEECGMRLYPNAAIRVRRWRGGCTEPECLRTATVPRRSCRSRKYSAISSLSFRKAGCAQ